MKKVLKTLLIVVIVVLVAIGGFLGFLTVTEYRPADVEVLPIQAHSGAQAVPAGDLTLLSWNIGYAGLGRQQDFFMDGGTKSKPGDRDVVH